MSSIQVPTPSSATVDIKSKPEPSRKNPAVIKLIKQLEHKSIYSVKNPLGRVIACHERLRSTLTEVLELLREKYGDSQVDALEKSYEKLFDHLVKSLEEATSDNGDPQWNNSNAKD